jgi:hypothetical protein
LCGFDHGYDRASDARERLHMTLMDPDDREFGRKAVEDQETAVAPVDEGVEESALPDEPPRWSPRAGRQADEA